MNYSRQRELISSVIMKAENHPTVEQIYNAVQKLDKNISLATVYRNIKLLIENGTIKKLSISDYADHYDPICKEHNHFICKKCGQIIDIFNNATNLKINKIIREEIDAEISECNVIVYGICNNCKLHK